MVRSSNAAVYRVRGMDEIAVGPSGQLTMYFAQHQHVHEHTSFCLLFSHLSVNLYVTPRCSQSSPSAVVHLDYRPAISICSRARSNGSGVAYTAGVVNQVVCQHLQITSCTCLRFAATHQNHCKKTRNSLRGV